MVPTNQIEVAMTSTKQRTHSTTYGGNSAHKHIPEEQFTSKVLNSQTGKHVHRQTAKIAESRTDSGTD